MLVIAYDTLRELLLIMEENPAIYDSDDPAAALILAGDLAKLHAIEVDEGVIFP